MNETDILAQLKTHGITVSGDDVLARIGAIASAPESLVDGPDAALVLPDVDDASLAAVAPALRAAIRDGAAQYKQDIGQENGATRLAALRAELSARGLDGFVVPMADEYQNEYVPSHSQRLAWLSGFAGSAGTVVVLADKAAIFVDGRYTLQVRDQVDTQQFETLGHDKVAEWLDTHLLPGQKLGYDAWLHTENGLSLLTKACDKAEASLIGVPDNPVDAIWEGQPPAPLSRFVPQSLEFSGEALAEKTARMGQAVEDAGAQVAVLTAPDSIAWLLNIRGADVAHSPLPLSYALLGMNGAVELFVDPRKCDDALHAHLGDQVRVSSPDDLKKRLTQLGVEAAQVMIDPAKCPSAIIDILCETGAGIVKKSDPCQGAKAIKNDTEIQGAKAAHKRDGLAMVRFMAWFADQAIGDVDEFDVADKLEDLRRDGAHFRDLSFPTIAGSGANGALVHYGASEETNRSFEEGDFLLVDSGAQYLDGTTDATRTYAIGSLSDEQVDRFTKVLQCHIGLSSAHFPKGTTGHQLDVLARRPLWDAGLNFSHGTGHGVGSYLGVHEGPHNISPRVSSVPLEPGVVISNEPGFYKEGAYGIRSENLILVVPSDRGAEGEFLTFEPLTLAPFDRSAIDAAMLSPAEISWLDAYHARVFEAHAENLSEPERAWLATATAPICP